MSEIVFLSLFLGLVTGVRTVELQVSPTIHSVVITVDGEMIGKIDHPPWRADVDLGASLIPHALEAVGYDENNVEVARARQILNVPRPMAEAAIVLRWEHNKPVGVDMRWVNRYQLEPRDVRITVDGRRLKVDKSHHATLPDLDMSALHIVTAEVKFVAGITARSETVIEGSAGYNASTDAQLTAVAVNQRNGDTDAAVDCFVSNGTALQASAIEKSKALVIFVKDPDAAEARRAYGPVVAGWGDWSTRRATRQKLQLDSDTASRLLSPVANTYTAGDQIPMTIFEQTVDIESRQGGLIWLLTRPTRASAMPRRFADAVATAGVSAMSEGRRRAVVLILSATRDESYYSPLTVRRYLASIGVPLLVWSLSGPRPDLAQSWGEVTDVSTEELLSEATSRLGQMIAVQRIVWINADPLTALRASAKPRCAYEPLATALP